MEERLANHMSDGAPAFVVFVTAVAAMGGFLFGYDTAVINGAIGYLKLYMHLGSAQEGTAVAAAIVGCIPGAMCAGVLSDRFGRKTMLLGCALLYAVSGVCAAVPRSFTQFLAARFLSGLAIGASSMICPVYIAEVAPGKWRGRLGALFQLGIVIGIFLTLFINRVVHGLGDERWNTSLGWRWMLGLEAVPALVFLALTLVVPESPRWLAQQRRTAEAEAVLRRVRGAEQAACELAIIEASLARQRGLQGKMSAGTCTRPLAIAIPLMAFSQFSGINAVIYYSTKIFATAGSVESAAFTRSAWVGLVNLLFTVVAIALVDRAGRRPLLLVGTALQTVALSAVAWLFHRHQAGLALLMSIVSFIAAFAMAMGPVPWILCSELFPSAVRGRAMALATFTVWTSCYLVAQMFPVLNDSHRFGPAFTFGMFSLLSLMSFAFVLWFVPETKGRSLEEIEGYWKRGLAGVEHSYLEEVHQ